MSLVSSLVLVFLVVGSICLSEGQFNRLTVGFYDQTCPNAEAIVRAVVREAALSDSNMPAVLLRLHFHDCFVEVLSSSYVLLLSFLIDHIITRLLSPLCYVIRRAVMVQS